MNSDRWRRIEELFQRAVDLKPAERAAFLSETCTGDERLRREVESLLAHDSSQNDVLGEAISDAVGELSGGSTGPSNLQIGQHIGRYQVTGLLGQGGMGLVYKARDTRLQRDVAIKVLYEHLADKTARLRFEREVRTASALNHPNICATYDAGESDGHTFLVMELLEGRTLREYIDKQSLDFGQILRFGGDVAAALEAAHAKGTIHRDIKPSNIFVTEGGRGKILDFGVASRELSGVARESGSAIHDVLTHVGAVMGTTSYMSPEQARGEVLDARTDLWSLGVVLYEMATGSMPFEGTTPAVVFEEILNKTPRLICDRNPKIPAELERIICKALEKNRDLRYQHAADIRADLTRLLRDADSGGIVAPPRLEKLSVSAGLKAGWVLTALAILFAAAAASVYSVIGYKRAAPPFQMMSIERLTNVGEIRSAAISPDGKYLAFVVPKHGRPSLWIRQLATQSEIQIASSTDSDYGSLTFSLDGNYVYFVRYPQNGRPSELLEVPSLGGAQRKIKEGVDSRVTFAPDGKRLAFVRGITGVQNLVVADLDGGSEQIVSQRKGPDFFSSDGIAWSPDGKLIAVSAYSNGKAYIMIEPVLGGQLKPLGAANWVVVGQVAWLSDLSGIILIASESRNAPGQIWEISYPSGQSHRITNDLNNYFDLSLTGDSDSLIAAQGELLSNIWTVPSARWARATQVTFGAGTQDGFFGLGWIPGGDILYASLTGGTRELWVMTAGSRARQVTTGADIGFFSTPSVCPNGHTVVFATGLLGTVDLLSAGLDGGKPKPLVHGGTNGAPSCSPDGKWVYFNALDGSNYTLWRVPSEGGKAEQLTHYPSTYPVASPDGKAIAFNLSESSPSAIGIIPASGGQAMRKLDLSYLFPGGAPLLRWSPAGNAIDYINERDGVANIWRQGLEGGPPQQISYFTNGLIFNFAWSKDGKDLAVARGSRASDVVRIRHFRSGSF